MNEPPRPRSLLQLSADGAAALLATGVFVFLGLAREVVGSVEFAWIAVSAQIGPERMAGDLSLLPWLLWGLHGLIGDVIWSGRALSVLSGIAVVVFTTRILGPWAGLWLMAQSVILVGVAETDPALPALALLVAALSTGRRGRFVVAGACAALAVGCGSWSMPVALAAVWISRRRGLSMAVFGGVCALLHSVGIEVIPRAQWAADRSAMLEPLATDWALVLGFAALLWGAIRGGRPSRRVLGLLAVSTLAAMLIPDTPRSLLIVQAFLALGVAAVESGPALLLLSLVTLGVRLPGVYTPSPVEQGRAQVIASMNGRPGKALCTDRRFVRSSEDGWLRPCVGLDTLGRAPSAWVPVDVLAGAQQMGARWLAVETGSVTDHFQGLLPLLGDPLPPGFEEVASSQGWIVFSLESVPRLEP